MTTSTPPVITLRCRRCDDSARLDPTPAVATAEFSTFAALHLAEGIGLVVEYPEDESHQRKSTRPPRR